MLKNQRGTPYFSIVIPTLNEEVFLPKLLIALSKQQHKDFEVIVVDARSEDKTLQKAKAFHSQLPSLKVLTSQKRNVSFQRNLGAFQASGKYLVFLDADVLISSNFLTRLKVEIDKQKPDILTSWITTDGYSFKEKIIVVATNLLLEVTKGLKEPIIFESMFVTKKSSFNKLRGFNQEFHNNEGSDLVERAKTMNMKFMLIREPRYYFSYRRAKKYGYLRVLLNVLRIETAKALNKKMSWNEIDKLYPMQGGKTYNTKDKL